MRKFLIAGLLAGVGWLCPVKAQAVQFSLPYVTAQSTTIASATLVLSTNTLVSTAYMHCIQHVTVQSNTANSQFIITTATVTSTGTLSPDTTSYAVTLSSGVPYDSQWSTQSAWCGPPYNQVNLKVTNGGTYTISAEEFTSKGWAP